MLSPLSIKADLYFSIQNQEYLLDEIAFLVNELIILESLKGTIRDILLQFHCSYASEKQGMRQCTSYLIILFCDNLLQESLVKFIIKHEKKSIAFGLHSIRIILMIF